MIGTQTLNTARDLIDSLFRMHQKDIDTAYLKADDSLSVSISVKFKPSEKGGIDVDAGISFVTERIKDNVFRTVLSSLAWRQD